MNSAADRAVARFHVHALKNAGAVIDADAWVRQQLPARHALFAGKPTPFSLTPFLLTPKQFHRLTAVCENLADVMEEAGRIILRNDGLLDRYCFPDFFRAALRIDPGYRRLAPVLRLDGHFDRGVFRIVETNADGSAGMNDSNAIERSVLETRLYRTFRDHPPFVMRDMVNPLARMLAGHARRARRNGLPGRIAILDIPGVSTESEFLAVRESLARIGEEADVAGPEDLSFDRSLRVRGVSVGVVYRRLVSSDACERWSQLAPLLAACEKKRIRMVGSFRSEILHSKAILAALNHRAILEKLSQPARRLLQRHVPISVALDEPAASRAVQSKNRWVIKPLDAYGSRGVTVGAGTTAAAWRRSLKAAIAAGRYLLQEYVPAPTSSILRVKNGKLSMSKEMTSVGFFLYNGKMSGAYVRSGPIHPLSISRGAVTRPGFVLGACPKKGD